MAAPKGNQFWKLATKYGRDKLFSSPEILWEASCEYFEWCDENPLISVEQSRGRSSKKKKEVTKDGIEEKDTGLIDMPLMRAYTWEALELYLNIGSLRDYKTEYKDFKQVITRIGNIIYSQKFSGAAAGLLNANIIARDLGLVDQTKNQNENKNYKVEVHIFDEGDDAASKTIPDKTPT